MTPRGHGDWHRRRVLVTGGTGFIGVNLCRRLVAEGAAVTVLSRRANASATPGLPSGIDVGQVDVRDRDGLLPAITASGPQVLFHLASTVFNPPGTSEAEHRDVIVGGTAAVLAAVRGRPLRLVHIGSGAEYGAGSRLREDRPLHPTTALGRAKAEASRVVMAAAQEGAVDAVILRLFTPYGPWDRPTRLVIDTALRALGGESIPISDGRQQRDLVYVDDVVDALLAAATREVKPGSVYNVCSGVGISVRTVVDLVLAALESRAAVIPGSRPTRPDEIWVLSGDGTAAERDLGWRATTDLRIGIARTCAWVVEHRERLIRALAPASA